MRDENGETRRERNERFGHSSPEIEIPEAARHLWEWYFDLSRRLRRVRDGACEPIPPSEFMAWKAATRNVVHPHEYAMLCQMDVAYCDEMGMEIGAYYERKREEADKK